MENYPPKVRTPTLPVNPLSKSPTNRPDHQLHPPKSPRRPLSRPMVVVPRHLRLRRRPSKKRRAHLQKMDRGAH